MEPTPPRPNDAVRPVVISVEDSPAGALLGQLYGQALQRRGRAVEIRQDDRTKQQTWAKLGTGEADLVFACTGALLASSNPDEAAALAKKYRSATRDGLDPSGEQQWREDTYEAMSETLAPELEAADPSRVQYCDDASLPQSLVPVYHLVVLDRKERKALNDVTGALQAGDLATMQRDPDPKARAAVLLDQLGA